MAVADLQEGDALGVRPPRLIDQADEGRHSAHHRPQHACAGPAHAFQHLAAGTGVLWTISGGVPHSLGLVDQALAAEAKSLSFLQISDSHMGFDKPANPNAKGTLEEAVGHIKALPVKPAFMIHTGDITHLSKESEFDDADKIISQAKLDVHYVPGEHDIIDPEIKIYKERYGRGTKGSGYYSFDANGVHFMGLVNVVNLKAGGMGSLGDEQLEWIEDDLKGRSASTPIVVFAHIPLWTVYPEWGWGTEDSARRSPISSASARSPCSTATSTK